MLSAGKASIVIVEYTSHTRPKHVTVEYTRHTSPKHVRCTPLFLLKLIIEIYFLYPKNILEHQNEFFWQWCKVIWYLNADNSSNLIPNGFHNIAISYNSLTLYNSQYWIKKMHESPSQTSCHNFDHYHCQSSIYVYIVHLREKHFGP
jgi:hypothetical protein